IPYRMEDGRIDNYYGRCPLCLRVFPKNQAKHKKTKQHPLGYLKHQETDFHAIAPLRSRSSKKIQYEKPEVSKLAGKEHTFVKQLLDQGVLVSYSHESMEEEQ